MSTKQFLPSFLPAVILGAVIGFTAATFIFPSSTCPAPPVITQNKTVDGSVSVRWDANKSALGYLVWARDSTLLNTDSVSVSVTVTGNEVVIPGLLPNHGYLIQVFGICKDIGNKFSFSSKPVELGVRTGWIIVEDVVDFGTGNNCPYGNCDVLVTNTDTCFNWGPGNESYSVEVRKRNGNGNPDTLVSRFYMDKIIANNTLDVRVYANVGCGLPQLNAPTKAHCNAKQPPFRFCGTAQAPGIAPTEYSVNVDFANCCITGFSKSNYQVTIRRCHGVVNVQ